MNKVEENSRDDLIGSFLQKESNTQGGVNAFAYSYNKISILHGDKKSRSIDL